MAEDKFGAFFNKAVKTVRSTTDSVTKKTGEIVELTKAKVAIADMQNDIDAKYTDIGKLVFEAFAQNTTPSEAINEKCEEIAAALEELEALKAKLSDIKEEIKCPECGAENAAGSQFCSKCGAKL